MCDRMFELMKLIHLSFNFRVSKPLFRYLLIIGLFVLLTKITSKKPAFHNSVFGINIFGWNIQTQNEILDSG